MWLFAIIFYDLLYCVLLLLLLLFPSLVLLLRNPFTFLNCPLFLYFIQHFCVVFLARNFAGINNFFSGRDINNNNNEWQFYEIILHPKCIFMDSKKYCILFVLAVVLRVGLRVIAIADSLSMSYNFFVFRWTEDFVLPSS